MKKPIRFCWYFVMTISGFSIPVMVNASICQKFGAPSDTSIDNYSKREVSILMGSDTLHGTAFEFGKPTGRPFKMILPVMGNLYKISVPPGSKYSFTLPNGTNIFLNSGSKLLFNPEDNYMDLSGEGYFKFTKNTSIISFSPDILIKSDSGSCINITAYKDYSFEPLVIATLIKGREVTVTLKGKEFALSIPGDEITIDSLLHLKRNSQSTEEVLSWTTEVFRYKAIDPFLLLARIGRWYGKNVEFYYSGPRRLIPAHWNCKTSIVQTISGIMDETNDYTFLTNEYKISVYKYHLLK